MTTAPPVAPVPVPLAMAPLAFDGVTVPALSAPAGSVTVLVAPKGEVSARLLRLLLGLEAEALAPGTLRLLGEDPTALDPRGLCRLRQRIGVVSAGGGLISNLKVVENLLLPLLYHRRLSRGAAEAEALALLRQVGYREHPMRLPGLLSTFERKQVALARAMVMAPELMVYEGLSHGVTTLECDLLLAIAERFQRERRERVSLYLTHDRRLVDRLGEAQVIILQAGERA